MSEGRRDQCEAPSDPKFPDCSGKVEVRPGALAGLGVTRKGGSSVGAMPQTSSGVPLLAGLSAGWGLSAQALTLTLALAGRGQPRGNCLSAWAACLAHQPAFPGMSHVSAVFIANELFNVCATAVSLLPKVQMRSGPRLSSSLVDREPLGPRLPALPPGTYGCVKSVLWWPVGGRKSQLLLVLDSPRGWGSGTADPFLGDHSGSWGGGSCPSPSPGLLGGCS